MRLLNGSGQNHPRGRSRLGYRGQQIHCSGLVRHHQRHHQVDVPGPCDSASQVENHIWGNTHDIHTCGGVREICNVPGRTSGTGPGRRLTTCTSAPDRFNRLTRCDPMKPERSPGHGRPSKPEGPA